MNKNLGRRIHPIAEADGLSPKKLVMMKDGCPVREYISIREMCRKENLDRRCVMRTLSGKYAHHHGFTFKIII